MALALITRLKFYLEYRKWGVKNRGVFRENIEYYPLC
jgi:hypothetical protein